MPALLRSLFVATAASALLCGAAQSQSYYYSPSDTPTVGTCNSIPWGQSSARHQHVVTAAELGNQSHTISNIAYAACASGTLTASQILIRMDHVAPGPLSATFATNLSANAVTVLNATNWSYAYVANAWADVGLTSSFGYNPALGDLLIDIEFCGASGGASFHRDVSPRAYSNGGPCPSSPAGSTGAAALKVRLDTGTGGTYTSFGQGCGVPALTLAGLGVPNIGTTTSVTLSNGDPFNVGFYGVDFVAANTSLAGAGAPGCTLYVSPLTVSVAVFDASGNAPSFDIPLPNWPGLVGLTLVHAGASLNPLANALGVTTSNGVTATVGM